MELRDAWPRRAKRGRGQVGATTQEPRDAPIQAYFDGISSPGFGASGRMAAKNSQ